MRWGNYMSKQNNIKIETLERFIRDLERITKEDKERGIKLNERYTEHNKHIYENLFGK